MKKRIKNIDLRVLSELMKNSRISDRELARKIGVSQPTVTRVRTKLEKEGYINEYTVIPNFRKLGYALAAITFVRYEGDLGVEQKEQLRKRAEARFKDESYAANVVLFERGEGFGYTGAIISFHESYSAFQDFLRSVKQFPVLNRDYKVFLFDLNDTVHYRSLSFAPLAKHMLTLEKGSPDEL